MRKADCAFCTIGNPQQKGKERKGRKWGGAFGELPRQNSFYKGQTIGVTLFDLFAVVVDGEVFVEYLNPRLAVLLLLVGQWVFLHECLELLSAEPLRRPQHMTEEHPERFKDEAIQEKERRERDSPQIEEPSEPLAQPVEALTVI